MPDDLARRPIVEVLTRHQLEFSVDRCAWLCACGEPPMPMHNDALRHLADAVLGSMAQYTETGELIDGWTPVDAGRLDELEDAEAAIERVREYADFLSRTSGRRPEVVAVDVAWAIRDALDRQEAPA